MTKYEFRQWIDRHIFRAKPPAKCLRPDHRICEKHNVAFCDICSTKEDK